MGNMGLRALGASFGGLSVRRVSANNVDTPHLCLNPPWLQSLQTHSGAIQIEPLSEFFNSAGGHGIKVPDRIGLLAAQLFASVKTWSAPHLISRTLFC